MTKKPYPKTRMFCAVCRRPMFKAAALQGGYPVGPVCAIAVGLLPSKSTRAHDPVTRDSLTLDLFTS
jgi:hypothetical protein